MALTCALNSWHGGVAMKVVADFVYAHATPAILNGSPQGKAESSHSHPDNRA